jgi:hypothetical protein
MPYLNPLRPAWQGIAESMAWTHSITISPHNPYLGEHGVYGCGCAFAKRMRDRESIGQGGVLLIPEQCPEGFWHYHGVVTHPMGTTAADFASAATGYLNQQMQLQSMHTIRGARFTSLPVPSVCITPRGPVSEAAVRYAMKGWEAQRKADNVIWC